MRLIDADGEYCINAMDNTGYKIDFKDGIGLLLDKHGQGICEFTLDDIPTVDDVDKVIKKIADNEELEEQRRSYYIGKPVLLTRREAENAI